jgi:hypothetical protein
VTLGTPLRDEGFDCKLPISLGSRILKICSSSTRLTTRNDNAEYYIQFFVLRFFHGVLHIIQFAARNYAFRKFINILQYDYISDRNLT